VDHSKTVEVTLATVTINHQQKSHMVDLL